MKYKLFIFVFVFILILAGTSLVTAVSDSYKVRWVVPSEEQPAGAISHISPSFDNKVPHIRLGEHLNFKAFLIAINKLKWKPNISYLTLLH